MVSKFKNMDVEMIAAGYRNCFIKGKFKEKEDTKKT